jgi:heme exporter protein D
MTTIAILGVVAGCLVFVGLAVGGLAEIRRHERRVAAEVARARQQEEQRIAAEQQQTAEAAERRAEIRRSLREPTGV